MRVTFVIGTLEAGGAQRNLLWLCDRLSALGHEATVVTLMSDAKDFFCVPDGVARIHAPRSILAGIPWISVGARLRRWKELRDLILKTDPDLVISFIDTSNIYTLRALLGSDVPVIVSERNDLTMQPLDWKLRIMRRLLYPLAAAVIMVSRKNVEFVASSMRPRWKARYIPNAVRVTSGSDTSATAPSWFGTRNIVAMGRLVPQKGFDLLLQAFRSIAGNYPDWHLTVIGEGEERATLENDIRAHGIADRVTLAGEVAEPRSIMRHADIFVLSSRYEGFPNALIEAMDCGLAVVSFDCPGGAADIVRHEDDGILVKSLTAGALAASLEKVIADDDLRMRLARASRDVAARFSEQEVLSKWLCVIGDAVSCPHNSKLFATPSEK